MPLPTVPARQGLTPPRRGTADQVTPTLLAVGLLDWWRSEFTQEEQARVAAVYEPLSASVPCMGGDATTEEIGDENEVVWTSLTPTSALAGIAVWLKTLEDWPIARRVVVKAEALALADKREFLALHFLYATVIQLRYRWRHDDPAAMTDTIEACERQIAIAPRAATAFRRRDSSGHLPAHFGYKKLAVIRTKQGDFEGAIRLCEKALAQGWGGDWEKRIARLRRRSGSLQL